MLRKLSIQKKLLITYIIVGLLSIPSICIVMIMFQQNNDKFSFIIQNSIPRNYALSQIREEAADFMMLANISKNDTADTVHLNKSQLLAILNEGNKWEAEYQRHTTGLQQNTFIDQKRLDQLEADFIEQASLIIDYHEKNANSILIQNEQKKLIDIQKSLNQLITQGIMQEYQYWKKEVASAQSEAKKARFIAITSMVFVALIILLFSVYLTKVIAGPIIYLRDIAIEGANGNYNNRIHINSEDEIGYLAAAINNMMVSLTRAKTITEKMQNINAEKLIYLGLFPRGLSQLDTHLQHFFSQTKVVWYYENILKTLNSYYEELLENVKKLPDATSDEITRKIDAFKAKHQVDAIYTNLYLLENQTQEAMSRLIDHLRNLEIFAIEDEKEPEPFDITSGLRFVISLAANELKENQQCRIDIDELPKIICQPPKIMHALTNILDNAFHAIANGGEVIITGKVKKREIVIFIQHTGIGLSEELKKELFNPLPITPLHGTGLGLYVAHEIILQQGGRIEVQSEEEIGTTFIITLPIQNEEVQLSA